jgi:sortase (surface protein transpeptidase)
LVLATAWLGGDDRQPVSEPLSASPAASGVTVDKPRPRPEAGPVAALDTLVPLHVAVPEIGVDAEVIELGLNSDGTLEVPSDFAQAGWWSGGSKPGEPGPAVIVGHVDSLKGPAVFYRLTELNPGDVIVVADDNGKELRFAVDRLEQHDKNDFPTDAVYTRTNTPTLRLVTCGGSFDESARSYRDNIIVFASLKDPRQR